MEDKVREKKVRQRIDGSGRKVIEPREVKEEGAVKKRVKAETAGARKAKPEKAGAEKTKPERAGAEKIKPEKAKAGTRSRKDVIKVEQLYREYAKLSRGDEEAESIKVLKGLDFTVKEQDFVGIMGKSGCGKTTLLKTIGLIDKPTRGNLYFCGKDTKKLWNDELADIRRREIGFVFQDFYLMDSLTVSENIMLPMVLDKKNVRKCMEKGKEYAEHFGLSHLMKKYPYELSGGEKQRVAISRALINNPDLILADEPTGNLDSKSGKIVIDALERINAKMKKTIIMVTHDPQVASHCKRIIFLKDGVILEDLRRRGTEEEFYDKIIERMKDL